jgi:L-malate glycosyltransferase
MVATFTKVHAQLSARNGGDPSLQVLLIGPSLRTWVGGQEAQLDLLARQWAGDAAVRIFLVPNNPSLPAVLTWAERIPLLRTLLRSPIYLQAIWQATKRAEIVHVFSASHSSFLLAPLPACLVGRLLGKMTLVHYHSRRAGEHLNDSAVARWILRRTDSIVVPSSYLAEVFHQFSLRATIVPNVVDLTQFPYQPRIPLRPRLLCTRNFDTYCGVDDVIRAFRRIQTAVPEARLCLVGKGKQESLLRRLIAELHLEAVEFAGAIPRNRIHNLYAKADIFINASRGDNMPVSILEAFASGLPVATTAAGGIPHMLNHEVTGLLCEVGDYERLANNVLRLLQDQPLAQVLAHNAHEAVQQCSWTPVRKNWLAVYESLAELKRVREGHSTDEGVEPTRNLEKGNYQPRRKF